VFDQYKADLRRRNGSPRGRAAKGDAGGRPLRKVEADATNRSNCRDPQRIASAQATEDEIPMRRAEERRLADLLARVSQRTEI